MKKLFKENDLVKVVTIALLVTLILTWIIPGGSFSGATFTKTDLTRLGISQASLSVVYAVSFFLQQLVYVLILGAFYGVISLTNGYKELVTKCAKFVKGKEIPVVLIISGLIALFVSLSSQVFVAMLFIPFIITVLLRANLDKKTAFIATFGSIFVGMIGATYGTEGLYYFNYYMQTEITTEISMRFGVLAIVYILFSLFNIKHIKSVLASKKSIDESKEDKFAVEKASKKNVKVWPMALLFVVLAVFAVLGYIRWEEQFNITCFTKFHEWLIGLKIGDHTIISYILGNVTAFGTWELYSILAVLLVIMIIASIIYKVSLDDIIEGISSGITKMVKPVILMILGYAVFVFIYWSPIVPTITNWILTSKFNPFSTTIAAFISSVITADFGFVGYSVGSFLTAAYADNLNQIFVIYPAMHGFAQMIAPTSVILLAGLSYVGISYKDWMKHIWKFIVALLVLLLIVFALLTYM